MNSNKDVLDLMNNVGFIPGANLADEPIFVTGFHYKCESSGLILALVNLYVKRSMYW